MVKTPPVADKRNISFSVKEGDDPVENAVVSIGDINSTTGSAGGCTLSNISDGEHTVNVAKYGYNTYEGTITVSEDNVSFEISLTKIVYDFVSYDSATKDNEYATGTAVLTGTVSDGYSEIEVITNSVEEFVGNKYYITSDAEADGTTAYELYSDAGTTSADIFVTISLG